MSEAQRHASQEAGREAGEAGHGWQHRLARVPGSPAAVSRLPGAPRERLVSVSARPSLRPCSWPCRSSTVPSASTSQPSTRAHANTSSLKWKSTSPPLEHGIEEPPPRARRDPREARAPDSGPAEARTRQSANFHECVLRRERFPSLDRAGNDRTVTPLCQTEITAWQIQFGFSHMPLLPQALRRPLSSPSQDQSARPAWRRKLQLPFSRHTHS